MQRNKGKIGERRVANWFTERGFPARRTSQHMGSTESSDIIIEAFPNVYCEVKYGKAFKLGAAILYDEFWKADDLSGHKEPALFVIPACSRSLWMMYWDNGEAPGTRWVHDEAIIDVMKMLNKRGELRCVQEAKK